jgi:hypothetical protein
MVRASSTPLTQGNFQAKPMREVSTRTRGARITRQVSPVPGTDLTYRVLTGEKKRSRSVSSEFVPTPIPSPIFGPYSNQAINDNG